MAGPDNSRQILTPALGCCVHRLRSWWSCGLFAQPDGPASVSAPASRRELLGMCVLLAAAALLLFVRLGTPLQEPDEARYAEVPRQMLAEGSWLVPVLHGQPYYDKPPLLYWLVMGTYRVVGVHDWAARLGSCVPAFLVVFVTWWWGRHALGARAALAGAFILCLSARFLYLGRLLTPDSLLCLWVVCALAAGYRALAGARLRWRWWLLSAAAVSLGLLTKGPVALVLAAAPLLAWQMLDPRTARAGGRCWAAYLAVGLGLAAPWYVVMGIRDPGFLSYFFWNHNAVRYVAPFDHAKPAWFYLPSVLLGMLPWAVLVPGFVRTLASRTPEMASKRPPALGFLLLAALGCLAFYSLSGCKRAVYILPAFPALGLAFGWYLDLLLKRAATEDRRLAQLTTILVLLFGIGGSTTATTLGLVQTPVAAAFAGACALGAGGLWWLRQRGAAAAWQVCGAATFALLFCSVYELLPGYARRFSLRGQVRAQAPLALSPATPVACYPRRWDSVSFYLGRGDVRAYDHGQRDRLLADLREQPATLLFVRSDGDQSDGTLQEVLSGLPPSLEFVSCGRQGIVTAGWVRRRSGAEVRTVVLVNR